MIKNETVFIIGAGASKELNFPTGKELIDQITKLLRNALNNGHYDDFSYAYRQSIQSYSGMQASKINELNILMKQIAKALPLAASIDNYIHLKKDNADIQFLCKSAIATIILKYERLSNLFENQYENKKFDPIKVKDTWYLNLSTLMFAGITEDNIEDVFKKTSIVCFNYDRCIEQYFYLALKAYFNISDIIAQKLIQNLNIIHPYGVIGNGLCNHGNVDGIDFGAEISAKNILNQVNKIKTFTEEYKDYASVENIREQIYSAENIVFLGFGFIQQNMELMKPDLPSQKIKRVIATTYGASSDDINNIEEDIAKLIGRRVVPSTSKSKCADLINDYGRSLIR